MAALLPLLAEVGTVVAEAGSVEALDASVGDFMVGAGKTAVGTYISTHTEEIVDNALGKGTYKKTINDLTNNATLASSFLKDFEFGFDWGQSLNEKNARDKKFKASHPLTQQEAADFNARLAQLYLNEHKPGSASCKCDEGKNDSEEFFKPGVPVIVGGGSGEVITDSNKEPISLRPDIEKIGTQEYGSKVAEFIVKFITHTTETPGKDISELLINNPHLLQVGKHYLDWCATQPVPVSTAVDVTKVYHGHNISKDKVFKDQQGHFSITDETGQVEVYTGRAAPRGASVTQLVGLGYIPPIHGVWCGPKSPNNDFPIDLLDTFSFCHDISYNVNGWFHEHGDDVYISRISQNLNRMGFIEASIARFCVKWFSTVGKALAKVAGSLKEPTSASSEQVPGDDFFEYLKKVAGPPVREGQITVSQLATSDDGRNDFYIGLQTKAEKSFEELAPRIGGGSGGSGRTVNPQIAMLIKSLPIASISF